jgi:DNA polymerase-3 subunit chi
MAGRQPVLLTTSTDNPNGAEALFLIDGAEPGDLQGYARALILFDGKDDDQLGLARKQWSALKGQGAALSYWKQSPEGRWEKQA